ncbi:MAG: hypothetical protein NC433_11005 [Clostridiales bacterium]|nr:hypothetical protein [Clostridiales bacterium]
MLYRAGKGGVDAESEDFGNLIDYVEDFVEETLDTVQVAFLYGTWTDSYGAVSFTFNEDGTIRITGMSDTLGVEAFTFTEVDSNAYAKSKGMLFFSSRDFK